jgi:hypothetical protein
MNPCFEGHKRLILPSYSSMRKTGTRHFVDLVVALGSPVQGNKVSSKAVCFLVYPAFLVAP